MDLTSLLNQKDKYEPMKAQNCNMRSIIELAENTAKNIDMSPHYDLRDLIENNGGTIHDITFSLFQRFENAGIFDNSIYVRKTGDFDIIIHAYLHFDQMRYTLAHELGHYVLHAKDMSFACQKGNDRVEQEAYWYAVGLLVPEHLFRDAYKLHQDTKTLALLFRLPQDLIKSRKRSLNLE
jgi:Zn-dependent peptidase ImmA (M78 family)